MNIDSRSHGLPFACHHGHIYAPAEVGGRTVSVLIDTCASASVVSLPLARSLAAPLGAPIAARGAGTGAVGGAMLAEPLTVRIPGTAAHGTIGVALSLDDLSAREGRDIHAILGADFIEPWAFEIDYPASRLQIHDPRAFTDPGGGVRIPLTFRSGQPHVQAQLEVTRGVYVPLDCVIDLGSQRGLALAKPFIDAHDLRRQLRPRPDPGPGAGIGGAMACDVASAHALRIGDLTLGSPEVTLFDEGAGVFTSGEFFDGNIGAGILRAFRIVLDYGRALLVMERR